MFIDSGREQRDELHGRQCHEAGSADDHVER
jgi:hypothetical protein